jgi:uncharacterized membrane protein
MAIDERTAHVDESLDRAKHPVSVAAGPYGHPFHPILVTVPIGAWIGSLVLDIGSRAADNGGGLARAAWWMIALGIIGAAVAAIFGLLDFTRLPKRSTAGRTALIHMTLNVIVLACFVASWIWREDRGVEEETSTGQIVLSIVALLLLSVSGWLGGRLSYHFGVRVARERDQLVGYDTAHRARR